MIKTRIQSIDRAVDILELFLNVADELSVKEISEAMQLSKSTVHGIIRTLETRGLLSQNAENAKYQLGMKLFELGSRLNYDLELSRLATPHIRQLVDMLGETVHLAVYKQQAVYYVEKVRSPQTIQISSQVGKQAMMYCTGVGKSILAFLSEEKRDWILSHLTFEAKTQNTHITREALEQDLVQIRQQFYALDNEEIEVGLFCIAAPIFDASAQVVASISCSAPKMRVTATKLPYMIEEVRRCALMISKSLGLSEVLLHQKYDVPAL